MTTPHSLPALQLQQAQAAVDSLRSELTRRVVGQRELVEHTIIGMLAGGNILLEGQPGLGKTLLVNVLAQTLELSSSRIQFTPDLMPSDITGSQVLVHDASGHPSLEFRSGPVFANLVLADEINRATPKTQSALLEAMQERAVTVAGAQRQLPQPFAVLATQNPVGMEGTYPLPEAQVDRFMLKLEVQMPSLEHLTQIGMQTTGAPTTPADAVMTRQTLLALQTLARKVVVAPHIAKLCAQLTLATHPCEPLAPQVVRKFVRAGASPRAMQALLRAGRAHALTDGRAWVGEHDVRAVAFAVLRHRLVPTVQASLEGVRTADVLRELWSAVSQLRAAG